MPDEGIPIAAKGIILAVTLSFFTLSAGPFSAILRSIAGPAMAAIIKKMMNGMLSLPFRIIFVI